MSSYPKKILFILHFYLLNNDYLGGGSEQTYWIIIFNLFSLTQAQRSLQKIKKMLGKQTAMLKQVYKYF